MALALRIVFSIAAALLLAGCAGSSGSFGSLGGGSASRPRTMAVSDFIFGDGVVGVDRGFTARLERKIGAIPTFERKQRTNERVNDEIVASIVASLREAGLDAQPGNEDTLQLKDDSVVVSGSLRAVDPAAAKKNLVGFGSGRAGVIAEMSVTRSKRQLLAFAAGGDKRPGGPAGGKASASREAAIAASLVASNAAKERLSPDVEAQARGLGRAIAEKVLGYAKEQGWLERPAGAETAATEPVAAPPSSAKPVAAPGAKPAEPEPEQRVRLPDPKPEPKSSQRKTSKKPPVDPDAEPDADPDPKN